MSPDHPAVITPPMAEPAPPPGEASPRRMAAPERHWALTVLATIAVICALDWAQSLFISLLLGILASYTLNPLVVYCQRAGMPRAAAACLVMMTVVLALLVGTYALRGQVQTIVNQLPSAAAKLSAGLADFRHEQADTMRKVEHAAREMEQATSTSAVPAGSKAPTQVFIKAPDFTAGGFLWAGSRSIVEIVGQFLMVLFLTLFLLLSGDSFKRKVVRLTGPTLSRRKITVRMLDEINTSIQSYLLMLLTTNVLVAMLSWLVLSWIGLQNAGAWAVAAGLLHLVPYFGAIAAAVTAGTAAFMQFDALSPALLTAGASLAIATLVGMLITTWMAGRFSRMNTAAVFVALLFWGWLWGVWGMLLSIPIMVIVNVVAQHLAPQGLVAELLGD